MIANCGSMGLDWRFLSLSAYLEALEAYNEANSGEDTKPAPRGDGRQLAAVMAARLG